MKFNNVSKGMTLLLIGLIAEIIGALLDEFVLAFAPASNSYLNMFTSGYERINVIINVVIIVVTAGIMIAGLVIAGKEERCFKYAWITLIILTVFQAADYLLAINDINERQLYYDVITCVAEIFIGIFILNGVINVLRQRGVRTQFPIVVRIIYVIALILSLVVDIIQAVSIGPDALNGFLLATIAMEVIIQLVAYILFLVVIGKSIKQSR